MIRSALFAAAVGAAGCSQQPQAEGRFAANVALAPAAEPPKPAELPKLPAVPPGKQTTAEPVVAKAAQPAPPPVFEYPSDLGGKAVVKAVTPKPPPAPAVEAAAVTPKPRAVPRLLRDPDAVPVAKYTPPPILPHRAVAVKLTPPPERVPVDLGLLAQVVPAKPTFPVAAGITERAPDAKAPPPLPILGRPLADRVSLDDPTAEFGNAAITSQSVKVSVPPAGFLKVSLPDPFELAAQVKPSVPPAAEPGLSPVQVNPQRVK